MKLRITRRRFNEIAVTTTVLAAIGEMPRADAEQVSLLTPVPTALPGLNLVKTRLTVNGEEHVLEVDPRVTLLDALRERLALTGSKKGCDHGQCGACTVVINSKRVLSCLSLAVMHEGDKIITIEGLASGDDLHPLQTAFIEHDGFQCGYCTPGQIMSAYALLSEKCGPADADVKECMSGNLCRCGAYPNIIAAIQEVRKGGSH